MNPETIEKLRTMAERGGTENERQMAKDILLKKGIDWRRPVKQVFEKATSAFRKPIYEWRTIEITKITDSLFIQHLCGKYKLDYKFYYDHVSVYATDEVFLRLNRTYLKEKDQFAKYILVKTALYS